MFLLFQINYAVIVSEKSRRRNKKFGTEEITFQAKIDVTRLPESTRNVSISQIIEVVRELFENILRRVKNMTSPNDLIRFCLLCDRLDKPISTCLVKAGEVTVENLLSRIMKVLQSKDEIYLDESFIVDIITIEKPMGGGRARRVTNVAVNRLEKRSILTIENDDDFNVCCAKSIIVAKAALEKDSDYKSLIRKDGNLLLRKALHLHMIAGIPEGPCGFEEISIFERFLDLQIAVVATSNMQKVINILILF